MDPTKRVNRYKEKVNAHTVAPCVTATALTEMHNSVAVAFPAIYDKELATKQILDGLGLPTIQYPSYLCYTRELYRLVVTREMSGESLAIEAQILLDKWVARGLVQSALEKVRKDVWSINAPVSP